MRRLLATTIAAAAIAAAGCGGDTASDTAQQARQQAQQTAGHAGADGVAGATQKLADQIASAARELADNPDADVDQRLQDAEKQAGTLSKQAQDSLGEQQPELSTALQAANERLAHAAADLRNANSADEVQRVLARDLGTAGDRLSDAAAEAQKLAGGDAQRRLEHARDQLQQLRDQVSSGGRAIATAPPR